MLNKLATDYTYTTTSTSSVSGSKVLMLVVPILAIVLIAVVSQWKIFKKAGKPGWAAIVPVYNAWVLFEITGYPSWLALLSLVPFVNFIAAIVSILASFKLAKLFGKSDFFAVMNVLFPFVTLPILAFGKAEFQGAPEKTADLHSPKSFDPTNPGPAAPLYPTPANTQPTPAAASPAPEAPKDETPPTPPPAAPAS